jgi:uncharacterized protein (TIGR03067 family)
MIRAAALLLTLALPALALDEPDPEPVSAQSDLKKMQGTWEIVRVERGGADVTKDKGGALFIIAKDQLTIREKKRDEKATFKIDARKKPAHIDISPDRGGKGEAVKGIYKLTASELTIVFTEAGHARPANFAGGKEHMRLVLRRQKAKK